MPRMVVGFDAIPRASNGGRLVIAGVDQGVDKERMMQQLHVIGRYRIHPGKFGLFRQAAAECLALVRLKDVGTLRYDWYLSGDRRLCVTIETYTGCEALLGHATNLGRTLDRLMSTADLSLELYGTASQELLAATEELPITFYSLLQGLD